MKDQWPSCVRAAPARAAFQVQDKYPADGRHRAVESTPAALWALHDPEPLGRIAGADWVPERSPLSMNSTDGMAGGRGGGWLSLCAAGYQSGPLWLKFV